MTAKRARAKRKWNALRRRYNAAIARVIGVSLKALLAPLPKKRARPA